MAENTKAEQDAETRSYNVQDAINHLKQNTKKRNFSQSFDLIINIKNVDLRKPENKFSKEIQLPHGRGKDVSVCVISDSLNNSVSKNDIDRMGKKEIRNLIKSNDFFISEAPLMPYVGKVLGRYLGPVGKMPSPFPPSMKDVTPLVNAKKNSVRIKVRDSPNIQVPVGTETMDSAELEENIKTAIASIETVLPKGKNQIKDIMLKLSMGSPVKLSV